MSNINVLDISIANLIAAGEVVDRPASAVKEMLENSLDAESKHITVEIQSGGIKLIRISDDGCGMSVDDLKKCILRHATSKIKNASDLDGIMTLGFRGEALAAISSVSKLRILTKRREDTVGHQLICDCGEIIDITDVGCHDGTTIIAEDLFANVPARRKFLKRDITEAMAVAANVEKLALSRPDVALRLISDGSIKLDTVGDGKLENAIYSILGRDFAKRMIAVDGMTEGICVNGYISSPENARGNRNCQNFFINGRFIKSGTITAALEDAYNSYIPSERYPGCVLNLIIHPAYVDVNVHPAKLEVKFSNEKYVYNAVYCSVRNALTQKVQRPEYELERKNITGDDLRIVNAFTGINDKYTPVNTDQNNSEPEYYDEISKIDASKVNCDIEYVSPDDYSDTVNVNQQFLTTFQESAITKQSPDNISNVNSVLPECTDIFYQSNIIIDTDNTNKIDECKITDYSVPSYRILGCSFNSYIFVELDDRIIVIDKHAAHERVLFETMKANMNNSSSCSQMLLLPICIDISPVEADILDEYKTEIEGIGLLYHLSNAVLNIDAIPSQLENDQASLLVSGLLEKLSSGEGDISVEKNIAFEKALYQASCKAAMKAGREDTPENIEWIVRKVMENKSIRFCPHGRPVAFDITKHEIEHKFKRL